MDWLRADGCVSHDLLIVKLAGYKINTNLIAVTNAKN